MWTTRTTPFIFRLGFYSARPAKGATLLGTLLTTTTKGMDGWGLLLGDCGVREGCVGTWGEQKLPRRDDLLGMRPGVGSKAGVQPVRARRDPGRGGRGVAVWFGLLSEALGEFEALSIGFHHGETTTVLYIRTGQ